MIIGRRRMAGFPSLMGIDEALSAVIRPAVTFPPRESKGSAWARPKGHATYGALVTLESGKISA